MKTQSKLLAILLSFVALLAIAIIAYLHFFSTEAQRMDYDQATIQAINECEGISSKSVMDLPEFLEFQKIEKQGRQSRVMQLCMSDRAYKVNPKWITQHQVEAHLMASKENISDEAALEELKRKHMYQSHPQNQLSLLWVKTK